MSQQQTTELAERKESKPFEASEAKELAEFYSIPQSLINLFWMKLGGTAYPKAPFKRMAAEKKGIQRIGLQLVKVGEDDWKCIVSIFPRVNNDQLRYLAILPPDERKEVWKYFTEPTVSEGRANKQNVRMSTMHLWLPEMAVTRGLSRTCGIYAGLNQTGYEELDTAELSPDQIKEAGEEIQKIRNAKPVNERAKQEILS